MPEIGVYLCVHMCVCRHIYISTFVCECACESPSLKCFMLFSLATMKIFPKYKILASKPHSQGGSGSERVHSYAGDSMESKF